MKHILFPIAVACALSACSLLPVTTISKTELLTPTAMTAAAPSTYTDMMYYGADDTFDYFTRNDLKYRVYRTENAVPANGRFPFDNWQTGKLYREVVAREAANRVGNFLQKFRNAQQVR